MQNVDHIYQYKLRNRWNC